MKKYYISAASIAAMIFIAWLITNFFLSSIQIIDPVGGKFPISSHHDIVVVHKGCGGKADEQTFKAILDKGQNDEKDITTEFKYRKYDRPLGGIQEKWVADNYQWPMGEHLLSVTADLPEDSGCFFYVNDHEINLTITEYLEPAQYKGLLHDKEDTDEYFFKSNTSEFGSWFHFLMKAENPSNLKLYFRLIDPKGALLKYEKEAQSDFWIALGDGVSASVKVSQDEWSQNIAYRSYTLEVISESIADKHESNDSEEEAKPLKEVDNDTYMASVLAQDGKEKGLKDFFFFEHEDCVVDCVQVMPPPESQGDTEKSPYYLEYIGPQGAGKCNNGQTNSDTVCSCDDEEGNENRLFSVTCVPETDCKPYGIGAVPDRYFSTYSISWKAKCKLNHREDVPQKCDRENIPSDCN